MEEVANRLQRSCGGVYARRGKFRHRTNVSDGDRQIAEQQMSRQIIDDVTRWRPPVEKCGKPSNPFKRHAVKLLLRWGDFAVGALGRHPRSFQDVVE